MSQDTGGLGLDRTTIPACPSLGSLHRTGRLGCSGPWSIIVCHIEMHVSRSVIDPVPLIVHCVPSVGMGIPVSRHITGNTHEPGIFVSGIVRIRWMIQFCKITESAAFIIVDITYMKIGMFACPHWPQDEELPSL